MVGLGAKMFHLHVLCMCMCFIARIGTLPGFNCTENDLTFLQRMQTIKQYEELKVHNRSLA